MISREGRRAGLLSSVSERECTERGNKSDPHGSTASG